MGERENPVTAPQQPPSHPTKQAKKAALTSGNVAAYSAGTICRPAKAITRDKSTVCPRIHADRGFAGRWLVEHQGHCYPFPSYPSAVKAALNPRHLCKFACICPVRGRESA